MEFRLRKLLCADFSCLLPPAPPASPLPPLPASSPSPPASPLPPSPASSPDRIFSKFDGSKHSHDISPFLIPMFCALGVAFIVVAYFTFFKKYYLNSNNQTRRRNPRNLEENQQDFVDENHGPVLDHPIWYINTIGLQQSVIDSIAVFRYKKDEGLFEGTDCSVCLNEFEEDEALRLLPKCSHAFHIPCIDTWLRSHKNCPSCRAPIVCEGSDTQTGETGETNLGPTPVENLDSRNEVRSHQEDSTMGGARTEFLGGLPSEEGRPHPRSDSKNCDIRVFSDLGGFRAKVKEELEPVRRSISMDASSASMIHRAMANIHEAPQVEGCSSTPLVQSNTGNSEKVEKSRLMKTSSLRYFLEKGPVSMKRSFSSSGKLLLPRRYSRSQDSNVPL